MNIFKNKILIKIAFINYLFFTLYIIMFFRILKNKLYIYIYIQQYKNKHIIFGEKLMSQNRMD